MERESERKEKEGNVKCNRVSKSGLFINTVRGVCVCVMFMFMFMCVCVCVNILSMRMCVGECVKCLCSQKGIARVFARECVLAMNILFSCVNLCCRSNVCGTSVAETFPAQRSLCARSGNVRFVCVCVCMNVCVCVCGPKGNEKEVKECRAEEAEVEEVSALLFPERPPPPSTTKHHQNITTLFLLNRLFVCLFVPHKSSSFISSALKSSIRVLTPGSCPPGPTGFIIEYISLPEPVESVGGVRGGHRQRDKKRERERDLLVGSVVEASLPRDTSTSWVRCAHPVAGR